AIDEAARCTEVWFKEDLAKATSRLHTFKAQ
ncbi:aminoacyl-tRNA hydrolase, partial [Escherichia coli]|nr:aminoacyl-tRNA hydrolase [Escherichia coli]